MPATTLEQMEENNSKKNIEILSNTPTLQAVKNSSLNITQAVFYKGSEVEINESLNLISDNPGIVMVKIKDNKITEISVSDPSRNLTRFNLSVSTKIDNNGDNFWTVWNANEALTHISIALPTDNYAGDSVTIQLN